MKNIKQLSALILFLILLCSAAYAAEEICNFLDDDGDGEIDEGLGRGDDCTVGVGECEAEGYIICAENEIDAICNAVAEDPSDEICDQKDNDCDGETDEGDVCAQEELCNGLDDDGDGDIDEDFNVGEPCYEGRGECRRDSVIVCEADGKDHKCNATAGTPSEEVCDGKDNDCDGKVDEGDVCYAYIRELCNGIDDNRDGRVDEGFNLGMPCDGPDSDLCMNGVYACDAESISVECTGEHPTDIVESCDGIDNDCDGYTDEGCLVNRTPVEYVARTIPEEQNDTGAQDDAAEQPGVISSATTAVANAFRSVWGFFGGLFSNRCKGVVCPPSVKTCPDGSEARCKNKCRKGKCSSCKPVCPTVTLVSDADGDGIANDADQCPQDPGLASNKGCPLNLMVRLPSDLDIDEVDGDADQCPQNPGLASNNGCPFTLRTSRLDSDNDRVIDDADQCPTEAGFVTNNGCPSTDTDGDGFDDNNDYCPNVAGTLSTTKSRSNGCPSATDTDGDGIDDDSDQCPQSVGLGIDKGCPLNLMVRPLSDPDGDGIEGNSDLCPQNPGPAKNRGCAFIPLQILHLDSDDDGTIDDADQCPTESGFVTNDGCPSTDTDGDGFDDINDYCPNVAGTLSTTKSRSNGCPSATDTDGDGISDGVDQCPQEIGLGKNEGCPSTAQEVSPSDADDDGVDDNDDLCPQNPGPAKNRGCAFIPLQIRHLDSDDDGTIDDADQCPIEAGPVINSGCP